MKIAIIGASGRLGAALVREFQNKYQVTGFDRSQLDLTNLGDLHEKLHATDFDVVINTAAFTNVDLCETERHLAFLINGEAPGFVAEICHERGAKLIHFSTDYVFDGTKRVPYTEEDEANPISAYGESKLAGEKNVLAANAEHLVVRVSWVFGPDRPSFVDGIIKRAGENEEVDAIADKFSTPTYTLDIVEMVGHVLDGWSRRAPAPNGLGADRLQGVLHFANTGECTWREYAQWALECCDKIGLPLRARTVGASKLKDMTSWIARRPVYSVLSTARYAQLTGTSPRAWREAVGDYITHFYSQK
jgi:dTDP-4-dehydrorhamnose reductase